MQALLMRVGLDNENGGGLAPVYEDGRFDYIPIPERYESAESRSFTDMDDLSGGSLADHVSEEYRGHKPHHDPEFETYTYGDPTHKRSQLAQLGEDDLLIFYAGLQPEDFEDDPRLYVIGYFTVAEVHDLEGMSESERRSAFERFENNAHVKRTGTTPESKHPEQDNYPVIVEGKPDQSKLLDRARPLSDAYVSRANPQYYMLDSVANTTGYSVDKDLTRASGRWLDPDTDDDLREWLDDGTVGLVDDSTTLSTYVLRHDSGFAPNVQCGFCTLATCKPDIRKNADVGDWVIGTGSRSKNDADERLLYAIRVERTLSFDEYFDDPEFEYKKPIDGPEYDEFGDNIYYSGTPMEGELLDEDDERRYYKSRTSEGETIYYTDDSDFVQLDNPNHPHTRIPDDTPAAPSDQAVLVGRQFWYFGSKEVTLPKDEDLRGELIKGYPGPNGKQGHKNCDDERAITEFVEWLTRKYRPGVHGIPRDQGEPDPDHEHTSC